MSMPENSVSPNPSPSTAAHAPEPKPAAPLPEPKPAPAPPPPSHPVSPTPQDELHSALVEETALMESLAKQTKVRGAAEVKRDAWKKTQLHK
jgi:hypothetical protein